MGCEDCGPENSSVELTEYHIEIGRIHQDNEFTREIEWFCANEQPNVRWFDSYPKH